MTIYFPPKVESTRTPFIYTDTSIPTEDTIIRIYFTYPNLAGHSPVGIDYSIKNSINNISLLTGGAPFLTTAISTDGTLHWIEVSNGALATRAWTPNLFYKINLRFSDSASVKSEWSTSCYVKAINECTINLDSDSLTTGGAMNSEAPLFFGSWVCEGELADKYKFILTNLETNAVEDSGWIVHDKNNVYDTHSFKTALENSKSYTVEYQIQSVNNFIDSTSITFIVGITYLTGISFSLEVIPDAEEGVNIIHMEGTLNIAYDYILKRSSTETNYSYWEEIGTFSHETATFSSYFNDFYIKYGIGYKYCLQATNGVIRSTHLAITDSIKNYYEHIYIVSKEKQLKIAFNPQVPSFKNNVETTIIKTLGGQYPIVFRNPNLKYKSLDLRGTISFNLDNMQYFFSRGAAADYLETSEIIGSDNNLNNENIALEFLFREAVLEFLTNSEYKLFKSPTEGFFIAATTDVNLSPHSSLGRAIFDFNCLITQTEDASVDKLKNYKILTEELSEEPKELEYDSRSSCQEEITVKFGEDIEEGSSVYVTETYIPDSALELDLPTGFSDYNMKVKACDFSRDGNFLAITGESAIRNFALYKIEGDSFTELNVPIVSTGSGVSVAFSKDSNFLALANGSAPYLTIYKRTGSTFINLENPFSDTPPSSLQSLVFSPDGNYLIIGKSGGGTPYIIMYKINGDTFTRLPNPAQPGYYTRKIALSPCGNYLAHTTQGTPYFSLFKRSGDSFVALPQPSVMPPYVQYGTGWGCEFSSDGNYFMVGMFAPYIYIYKREGDTFTKINNPDVMPTNMFSGWSFEQNSEYLFIGSSYSPYYVLYKRVGDVFTKQTDFITMPNITIRCMGTSVSGRHLVIGGENAPFMAIYKLGTVAEYRAFKSYDKLDETDGKLLIGYAKESGLLGEEKKVIKI